MTDIMTNSKSETPTKHKIAIIDDEADLVYVVSKRISSAGYTVACHSDGKNAANFIAKEKPSLIILDIMLPQISGVDVFLQLKRNTKLSHIPVIFFSGNPAMESYCLEKLGAEGFISKPYNPNQFLDLIKDLLKED